MGAGAGIALKVRAVEKRFGRVTAVEQLSFEIRRGEIFALLGPNGAGKTTTVRMLMGILRPDSGAIDFSLSAEIPAVPSPGALGYLPEDRELYQDTAVLPTLVYFRPPRVLLLVHVLRRARCDDRRSEPLVTNQPSHAAVSAARVRRAGAVHGRRRLSREV